MVEFSHVFLSTATAITALFGALFILLVSYQKKEAASLAIAGLCLSMAIFELGHSIVRGSDLSDLLISTAMFWGGLFMLTGFSGLWTRWPQAWFLAAAIFPLIATSLSITFPYEHAELPRLLLVVRPILTGIAAISFGIGSLLFARQMKKFPSFFSLPGLILCVCLGLASVLLAFAPKLCSTGHLLQIASGAAVLFLISWKFHTDSLQQEEDTINYRKLRTQSKQLQKAAESAHLDLWAINLTQGVIEWSDIRQNPSVQGQIPLTRISLEVWTDMIHPDDRDQTDQKIRESMSNSTPLEFGFRIIGENGAVRYMNLKAYPASPGEKNAYRGACQDISEFQYENVILRNRIQRAETEIHDKETFLANMNHELRIPLNGIIGFISLLEETRLNEEQSSYLTTISKSSDHLLELLNDIIDYTRIESGKMPVVKVPVKAHKLLKDITEVFAPTAQEKGLELKFIFKLEDSLLIELDEIRLRQSLVSLLNNALKFTEAGQISITANYSSPSETLRIQISDTGVGIHPTRLTSLFKPFEQMDFSNRQPYQGGGLGLAIAQSAIKLLDGTIDCRSKLGQGTTFDLSLPAPKMASSEITQARSSTNSGTPLPFFGGRARVLIVEDNEVNRELLTAKLEKSGINVQTAGDGTEAVELVRKYHFDLIFMDIAMPNMDGYDATRSIRKICPGRQPLIFALTAKSFKEDKQLAVEVGMNGHIAKPVKGSDLLSALSHLEFILNR